MLKSSMTTHQAFVLHAAYPARRVPDGTWRGLEKCWWTSVNRGCHRKLDATLVFVSREAAEQYLKDHAAIGFRVVELTLVTPAVGKPLDSATMDRVDSDDHELTGSSTWIKVDNIAVYVRRTDEGVVVDLYADGQEDADAAFIGGTWVGFAEAAQVTADILNNAEHGKE